MDNENGGGGIFHAGNTKGGALNGPIIRIIITHYAKEEDSTR